MKKKKMRNYPLRRLFNLIRDSLISRVRSHDFRADVNQRVEINELPSQTRFTAIPAPDCQKMSFDDKNIEELSTSHIQELFVVWDAIGDGRLVGVFTDERMVRQIIRVNPNYYRYYRCTPGQPTELALSWLDEARRIFLQTICNPDK